MVDNDWWFRTHVKKMTSSIGTMTFPTVWNNNIHVPNHQFFHVQKQNNHQIIQIEGSAKKKQNM